MVSGLGLTPGVSSDAVLADGSFVELETCICYLDWFGGTYKTQAVATDAEYPLLGTHLLNSHRLIIDYVVGTVELT
jgi:hypothetical protein